MTANKKRAKLNGPEFKKSLQETSDMIKSLKTNKLLMNHLKTQSFY